MVTNNTLKPLAENNETLFLLHVSGAKHSSQFGWEEGMAASSQSLSTGTSKCLSSRFLTFSGLLNFLDRVNNVPFWLTANSNKVTNYPNLVWNERARIIRKEHKWLSHPDWPKEWTSVIIKLQWKQYHVPRFPNSLTEIRECIISINMEKQLSGWSYC